MNEPSTRPLRAVVERDFKDTMSEYADTCTLINRLGEELMGAFDELGELQKELDGHGIKIELKLSPAMGTALSEHRGGTPWASR